MKKQKICIIGNGLTGLTTALMLGKLDLEVNLIAKLNSLNNLVDNRTTAISPSNYEFLFRFLNKKFSKFFWPIKKIDLFHEEQGNYNQFMNFEKNGKNLMYIVKNNTLKKIIIKTMEKNKKIKVINEGVKKIDEKNSVVFLKNKQIKCDSIFLCVGRYSDLTKKLLGKRVLFDDFNETAFTTIVKHNANITNSKQYFLKEGPMAILPFNKKEFSLVWSVNKQHDLEKIKNLIRVKLKKILNTSNSISFSKIDFFPVSFKFNTNYSKKNALVLGEGAYNVHPVAGQGFNLILRDIKALHQSIKKYLSLGMQIKDSVILHEFMVYRKPENFIFGLGLGFVHKFFKYDKISNPIKKIILKDINSFGFLKNLSLNFSNKGIF
tara:strand:+ start:1212 stop:2345 length:1134 start_codon:yes stop_codon:yes gene_type:complete